MLTAHILVIGMKPEPQVWHLHQTLISFYKQTCGRVASACGKFPLVCAKNRQSGSATSACKAKQTKWTLSIHLDLCVELWLKKSTGCHRHNHEAFWLQSQNNYNRQLWNDKTHIISYTRTLKCLWVHNHMSVFKNSLTAKGAWDGFTNRNSTRSFAGSSREF